MSELTCDIDFLVLYWYCAGLYELAECWYILSCVHAHAVEEADDES